MTTLDLEPIKERLAAATPGPWRVWRDPDPTRVRATAVETAWCYGDIEGDTELITDYLPTDADAEFIANAPEDIASLVAEVERLRATVIVEQNRRQPWVKLAHQNSQEVKRLRGQIDAVRAATANHPNPCSKHPEDDPVSCGWKSAYIDVVETLAC